MSLNEIKSDQPENVAKLRCSVHGFAPWFMVGLGPQEHFFCLVCVVEALQRLGVRGMFPVIEPAPKKPAPVDEFPESLEVEIDADGSK